MFSRLCALKRVPRAMTSIPSARGAASFGDIRSSATSACLLNFDPRGVARLARIENDAVPAWSGLTPWITEDRADEVQRSTDRTAVHGRPAPRQSRRQLAHDDGDGRAGGAPWPTSTSCPKRTRSARPRLPPVLPLVTATPRYPIEAIRASEAGASRHVLPRRCDGCDRRAGDHRALGRNVSRADPRGARAGHGTRPRAADSVLQTELPQLYVQPRQACAARDRARIRVISRCGRRARRSLRPEIAEPT